MALTPVRSLDCVGLFCPMPILHVREVIESLAAGQVLEMTADDPAAEPDLRRWAARTGHELVSVERQGGVTRFLIRKAG